MPILCFQFLALLINYCFGHSTAQDRIKRADDIAKAYKHFRLEVAKSAEHSKTGRSISEKLLAQMEGEGGWGLHSVAVCLAVPTSLLAMVYGRLCK